MRNYYLVKKELLRFKSSRALSIRNDIFPETRYFPCKRIQRNSVIDNRKTADVNLITCKKSEKCLSIGGRYFPNSYVTIIMLCANWVV